MLSGPVGRYDLPMPQQSLAPTPVHGEYRKRGDKVD
jgi:hypothetical protein